MVKLGQTVKDRITGLTGIAMVRAEYLTGCVHIGIQPQEVVRKDEKITVPEWVWLDEIRFEVVNSKLVDLYQGNNPDMITHTLGKGAMLKVKKGKLRKTMGGPAASGPSVN